MAQKNGLKLEEILTREGKGKVIYDAEENKAFLLRKNVLSEISVGEFKPLKAFNLNEDIANLAKRGDAIALRQENGVLFYFTEDSLTWKREERAIGLGHPYLYKLLAIILIASFATPFALAFIALWLGVLSTLFIAIMWIFLTRFFPARDYELHLGDVTHDGENEVILNAGGSTIFLLDHSTGSVLEKIALSSLAYENGSIIHIPQTTDEDTRIWMRAKKGKESHALSFNSKGKVEEIEGLNLIEVFDWNNNGEKELVAVSQENLSIISENREVLLEKKIPSPLSAYAGDINGDGQAELLLLNRRGEDFYLNLLKGENLSEYALARSSPFAQLMCIADINEDGQDEVIIKHFWEDRVEVTVYEFKPERVT